MREPPVLQQDQRRQCIKFNDLTDNIRLVCERARQLREKGSMIARSGYRFSCPSGKLYEIAELARLCKKWGADYLVLKPFSPVTPQLQI